MSNDALTATCTKCNVGLTVTDKTDDASHINAQQALLGAKTIGNRQILRFCEQEGDQFRDGHRGCPGFC